MVCRLYDMEGLSSGIHVLIIIRNLETSEEERGAVV